MKNIWLHRNIDRYYKSEIKRCLRNFWYFATNYAKFDKQMEFHPFHERLIDHYESNRFSLVTKFRQGAFLSLTAIFMTWNCLFRFDNRVLFISPSDPEAVRTGEMVQELIHNLPVWLRPNQGRWNSHTKVFHDTGSTMGFHKPEAVCGQAVNWLIIDEPAFVPDMKTHWGVMYPYLSTGGNCIALGTVGTKQDTASCPNWFYKLHCDSFAGKNKFKIFDVHHTEHPYYADPDKCQKLRQALGEEGWKQEVEMKFLD